jgi:DNA-binding IclR family transcriptional regulator
MTTRSGALHADAGSVKSAMRVLDLFEFLRRWDAECTHAQIAEGLDIPKSSLTQLLKTLANRGYLTYTPATKGYRLGPAINRLAQRSQEGSDIIDAAQAVLAWITAETTETCALNLLRGDRSEVVASSMSTQRLMYQMRIGDTAPLYATSGGKALLAYLPEEMRREYLNRVVFEKFAERTISSKAALTQELAEIKRQGVAYVSEEFTPGISGLAVPVMGQSGFPLASINIAMPTMRFVPATRDVCLRVLSRAVETIGKRAR